MSTLALPSPRRRRGRGAGVARAMPGAGRIAARRRRDRLALWPLFERVAQLDAGPRPALPRSRHRGRRLARTRAAGDVRQRRRARRGARRDGVVRERAGRRATRLPSALPADLAQAIARATEAFVRPLRAADERARALARSDESGGALREHGDAVAGDRSRPRAVPSSASSCERRRRRSAAAALRGALGRGALARPASAPTRRTAAASTSRAPTPCCCSPPRSTAAPRPRRSPPMRSLPPSSPRASPCAGGAEALAATAALMADARQSLVNCAQERGDARAHRARPERNGRRRWGSATSSSSGAGAPRARRSASPPRSPPGPAPRGLARVPWPLGGGREFTPARIEAAVDEPAGAFRPRASSRSGGAGRVARTRAAPADARRPAPSCSSLSSRIGYPGFVARDRRSAALLLLDLSLARPRRQPLPRALPPGPPLARRCCRSRSCSSCARRSSRGFAWLLSVIGETRRAREPAPRPRRRRRASLVLATAGAVLALRPGPREHAPADLRARPGLADRRRRLVLLPARRPAHRAPGAAAAARRSRSCATPGRCCSSSRVLVARDVRHARHGPAADRRLRVGRVPRRGGRDVVASPQRPGRRAFALAVAPVRGLDRRVTFALFGSARSTA